MENNFAQEISDVFKTMEDVGKMLSGVIGNIPPDIIANASNDDKQKFSSEVAKLKEQKNKLMDVLSKGFNA